MINPHVYMRNIAATAAAAIATAVGAVASAGIGAGATAGTQAAANRRQLENWYKQQEYNKQLWYEQQNYNSPQAQMERYKAAGLNPNLVVSDPGNAQTPSYAPAIPYQAADYNNSIDKLANIVGQIQQVMAAQAQISESESKARLNNSVARLNEQKFNGYETYQFYKFLLEGMNLRNRKDEGYLSYMFGAPTGVDELGNPVFDYGNGVASLMYKMMSDKAEWSDEFWQKTIERFADQHGISEQQLEILKERLKGMQFDNSEFGQYGQMVFNLLSLIFSAIPGYKKAFDPLKAQ